MKQLPTIEVPTYQLTVPSSGDVIDFRPFLVKEEKILLLAQEEETEIALVKALKEIVQACTFNKVDIYKLAMYDLEYIFLNIRSKSIGETSHLKMKCDDCDEYVPVSIDLTKVKVAKPKKEMDNVIQLTNDVGVTLKAPGLKQVENSYQYKDDAMSQILLSVIENIFDGEEVYPAAEADKKELINFIDSLTHQQLEEIQVWVENLPKLEHKVKFKSSKGTITERTLSGLGDFFI